MQDDQSFEKFMGLVQERKIELYPAQEEAILELFDHKNVILNTPTGSGKSLVATALHFHSLGHHRRSMYTSPIKALVNEKFLALCRDFGPEKVGMMTGDASVNSEAPIICCTAEILANLALRRGKDVGFADIVMDEFHYYSDRDRGIAWQIPLLVCTDSRFLLMSATLGDTEFFEKCLTQLNQRPTVVVSGKDRPVPLSFEYVEKPLHETIDQLIVKDRSPIYLVNFTQRECAEEAQNLLSVDFCSKEEKRIIATELEGVHFSSPYGKEIQKLLKHGIGIHHGGLLPKYRILVERLAQKGLLKVICGTDTLGVGVNVPIRTVLLTKLCKYDGEKTSLLSVRDFHQISGRAGRKGFDNQGYVVCQAPSHVIENLRLDQKAAGDPKKMRKIVKRKPPEKGYLPWNQETLTRLTTSQPESLISRFRVSHSMLLSVLSRTQEDGCRAMQKLIRDSHDSDNAKRQHRRTAFQLFRSLVDRKIIEFNPLRVNVELQEDFSLNHALSLYLLDTILLLDPQQPLYAYDLLTLVESILENPDLILRKQLDRIKTEKMDELKSNGVEYDERIAELEKLEYPKPNREFIYGTFNQFAAQHPWVGQDNIRPKSIAREMYETFQSFADYVRDYNLQRAEGLLLRYLSDVYKTLVQTVPDQAKNDELDAMIVYFGTMLHEVDSSLLEEWERLRNPTDFLQKQNDKQARMDAEAEKKKKQLQDEKARTVLLRNEVFRLVRALSRRDYDRILEMIEPSSPTRKEPWSISDLEKLMEVYYVDHGVILTSAEARSHKHTQIKPESSSELGDSESRTHWRVQQILVDPDGHCDWALELSMKVIPDGGVVKFSISLLGIQSL